MGTKTTGTIPLGTIRGIKVLVHWSWLLVFALITWSLASGYFPDHFKTWNEAEYWLVSAAAAFLLFVSVLIHELSHSFVAQAHGLPVGSITLYLFGGVSDISREPDSPSEEFWVTVAGPLSSIVLGASFVGLYYALSQPDWLAAIFGYLGVINIVLALFNLVPAFPLDGGRIFRSATWAITHDFGRATRLASTVSQWCAWGFILLGIWEAVSISFSAGLWMALIGWFLLNAATVSHRQAVQSMELQGITVSDAMSHPLVVPPNTSIDMAVHQYVLHESEPIVPVVDEGHLLGILSLRDIQRFGTREWPFISVLQAMTPAAALGSVSSNTPLADVITRVAREDLKELPVVDDGQYIGLVTPAGIAHYLFLRHTLGLDRAPSPSGNPGRGTAA